MLCIRASSAHKRTTNCGCIVPSCPNREVSCVSSCQVSLSLAAVCCGKTLTQRTILQVPYLQACGFACHSGCLISPHTLLFVQGKRKKRQTWIIGIYGEKGKLQKWGRCNWNTKNYGEVTEREPRRGIVKQPVTKRKSLLLGGLFSLNWHMFHPSKGREKWLYMDSN